MYEVDGITISEILEQVRDKEVYLKIDCEGAEYEILMNFPEKYMSNIKRMFVEFHSNINNQFIIDTFKNHGITIEEWE
jgi:FkbM family methyltransferase